jgi:hypothetical protein
VSANRHADGEFAGGIAPLQGGQEIRNLVDLAHSCQIDAYLAPGRGLESPPE